MRSWSDQRDWGTELPWGAHLLDLHSPRIPHPVGEALVEWGEGCAGCPYKCLIQALRWD